MDDYTLKGLLIDPNYITNFLAFYGTMYYMYMLWFNFIFGLISVKPV